MKKVAFLGSATALKPKIVLETLLNNSNKLDYDIVCLTNEDSGYFVDYCRSLMLEIIIFDDNIVETLKNNNIKLDLLVSIGWPHKIKVDVLEYFDFKAINCHGSYLPDYRGSRAYMHYWANCEEYFGATIHYINEKFDDGNILIQQKLKLLESDTPHTLHYRGSELCGILLPAAIEMVFRNCSGFKGDGLKRYFKSLSHQEFEKYRKHNEGKIPSERIMTPHKIIEN